jgi:hypothetical protein
MIRPAVGRGGARGEERSAGHRGRAVAGSTYLPCVKSDVRIAVFKNKQQDTSEGREDVGSSSLDVQSGGT